MEILPQKIDRYLHDLLPERLAVLQEMETRAAKQNFLIVGPLVGRFLFQYAKLIDAREVFELGSGFGYSALWFALALSEEGKVYCTERSTENLTLAHDYFRKAGVEEKLVTLHGEALELLGNTADHSQFDIILMDIDKRHYPHGLDLAWARVRKGGLLITDNTLWKGKVADAVMDADTEAIKAFNRRAFALPDGFATLLPVRDGVTVVMKLAGSAANAAE